MKPLVLTGISQETPLENPEVTFIHLVFNHGEVRVPTNEEGVQAILSCMASGNSSEQPAQPEHPDGVQVFGGEEELQQTPEDWLAQQEAENEDDDYEVNDGVGSI